MVQGKVSKLQAQLYKKNISQVLGKISGLLEIGGWMDNGYSPVLGTGD